LFFSDIAERVLQLTHTSWRLTDSENDHHLDPHPSPKATSSVSSTARARYKLFSAPPSACYGTPSHRGAANDHHPDTHLIAK
jgi:hypothetical protein